MKDKILFWIDGNFYNFFLSEYIFKNHDCESFAFFDITNNPKKYFKNQTFTNFSKTWFFHDYLQKPLKKPNISYLQNFEKKYNISLNLQTINERSFNEFNKFYNFTQNEILSILEQECKLFESILDEVEPNFLIMHLPFFQHDNILFKLCKSRGIKCLLLRTSRINSSKCLILEDDETKELQFPKSNQNNSVSLESVKEKFQKLKRFNLVKKSNDLKTKKNTNKLSALSKYLLTKNNSDTHFTYFGRTKSRVISKSLEMSLKAKFRKSFLDKNSIHEINNKEKFVYFPLHQDEEHATLIGAPFHTNQLEVIKNIAQSLPVGYFLYVKESPVSGARDWREISDYKKILSFPNVKLIHPSVDPNQIYENCSLVIAISGTSSLESLFYGKPSIIFSQTSFSGLSSIRKVDNLTNLPQIINESLNSNIDFNELLDYYTYVEKISFEFNLQKIWDDIAITFSNNGLFIDTEISYKQIQQFSKSHESEFNVLANEYIKKIKN